METVRTLRQKGYKVRVFHTRAVNCDGDIKQRGGTTEVMIFNRDNQGLITSGVSRCSDKDNYDKKLGVKIALGRALDTVPFLL